MRMNYESGLVHYEHSKENAGFAPLWGPNLVGGKTNGHSPGLQCITRARSKLNLHAAEAGGLECEDLSASFMGCN